MERLDFNTAWGYRRLGSEDELVPCDLPHDAMILEERSPDSPGGIGSAFFPGYDYEYVKKYVFPKEMRGKVLTLEFEGVYHDAEVYFNGEKMCEHGYGYTGFYVDVTDKVKFKQENEIRVIARNSDQPNSRWYSGAGIYRPVSLIVQDVKRILPDGIKVRTLSINPAVIEVCVKTSADGPVYLIVNRAGKRYGSGIAHAVNGEGSVTIPVRWEAHWSPDNPVLYTLSARFKKDTLRIPFGLRTVSMTRENGLQINGERVILRGACVHHDNGILGSRCYAEAEERKIRLLKENGYNAVRSAHNPCSKAMLDACDRLGVLVVDEYADAWYVHKVRFDYASRVTDNYKRDLADMVDKDYGHPSVIMYSLGNEVAETGEKRGIELFKEMKEYLKSLDPDRFVTVGVNILFNFLYSLGLGVYSDKKAAEGSKKKSGSEYVNGLASTFSASFMKRMALLPGCNRKTKACFALMDCAGYNYGILRYKRDLKRYKDRIILGSETFCSDAYDFYEFAKKNDGLIGDFVWAGMDYLGEVGIGAWEYAEYAPSFAHADGWISAGSGRLDLIGNPLGEALYTKVAFEQEDKPMIAVVPVSHTGEKHSVSAWKFSNAIPSWSWNGLDLKKSVVEVYSRAPVVELYVNGRKAGSKKMGKNCVRKFEVQYERGTVTAVNLDGKGNELSRNSLSTAKDFTVISLTPDKKTCGEGEIVFINVDYTDDAGTVKPLERGRITLKVTGGELLAAGHACPFNPDGFNNGWTDTYYGRALAVVKAGSGASFTVTASDGQRKGTLTVPIARPSANTIDEEGFEDEGFFEES